MKFTVEKKTNYLLHSAVALLLVLAIIWSVFTFTSSWLRDESITSNPDPSVSVIGTIDLDITTNFQLRNLVLSPDTTYLIDKNGEDIGTYIKTSEKHNIDGAYVRVKYTCDIPELTLYFVDNYTTTNSYATPSVVTNKWYYNEADGFYYYIGYIDDNRTRFNAGYYVDNTIDNTRAGVDCSVSLYFETIQRQYGASASDSDWLTSPQVFKDFVEYDSSIKHNPND